VPAIGEAFVEGVDEGVDVAAFGEWQSSLRPAQQ